MEEYSEGEEGLFEKIKNRFLDFIELLKEHKMPVAALAAVIVILIIALLVFGKPATADVRVNVMLGSSPAEGAVVELLDSGSKIASAKTVGGSASFKSVPVTLLLAKASKKGAGSASKELDLTNGAREFSLTLRQELIEGSVKIFVIDSAANAPVEGTRVEYALEQETGEATTDSNGTATLALAGSGLIRLRVSKTGFKTNVLSVLASKETIIVKLDPQELEPSIPLEEKIDFQTDLMSSVSASVFDEDGNPVSEGTVRVYDFDSLLLLGQANLAEGTTVVENIPSDATVFVNVESLEFLPYYGADDPKPVDSGTFFAVTLSRAALDAAETRIRTVDEENNLVASKMYLLVPPASILSEKDSLGEWTLKISPDLEYYAAANAEGFLPARSDSFASGDDVEISMTKATVENSASLKVAVTDEDGNALPSASVSIMTSDGLFIYPQAFTDENGEATFSPLALGEEYVVTADYLGNTATATVLLQQDATVHLAIVLNVGVLNADSFDTTTLEQTAANASIFEGKVLKAKCVTPCALRVRAGRELTFKANAAGYLNFESVFTVEIGESILMNASLTKIKDATKPWVSLDSVENAKNSSEANASAFSEGNDYKIKLSFGGPNESSAIGVFFRAGDLENVDLEPFGVTQIPTANLVYRSIAFLPDDANDAGECVDLLDDNTLPNADGLYKWFGLEFSGNANRQIEFLVKTKQNAGSFNVSNTSLHYSAYAVVESAGKKVYLRSPEDAVLGTDFSNPAKQWCHPTAFAREFGISFNVSTNETLNATPTPNATTLPSIAPPANLTESASIWIDPVTGEVKSNVEEIVMQADSIFPADAIPVDLQQQQGCTLLYQFTGSDFVNCFGYDEANKKLWFKARDFNNPSCAAKVKGNSIDSAEITLTFTAACTQKTLELPVRVEAASFDSIYGAPDSLSPGPGSAKLVYAINELQAPRTLEVKNGVERSVNVGPGTVASIAWSGPGTLSLTHEGESVKQWTYMQNEPVFGARGDLGSRTKSCSDFLCCASAWCNPTAFQQAYTAFKVKAGEIASATAFRRGEGEPWTYLSGGKNFEFASIAQVVENAKEILTQAGAPQPSAVPEECKPGNPTVYELRASTSDLKSWSYSTKVLRLEHNLQSIQNMSLCNFLQGEGENVTQTNESTLASNEQASDEHSTPKIIPSLFVLFPLTFTSQCTAAGTAYTSAVTTAEASLPTAIFECQTATTTACAPCPPIVPNCNPVQCTAGPACTSSLQTAQTALKTYATCLSGGGSATSCGNALLTASNAVSTSCSAAPLCAASGATVKADLTAVVTKGNACEATRAIAVDIPGIIPPRISRANCFVYSNACVVHCQPKAGYAMVMPWGNQLYCMIHIGITEKCTIKPPSAREVMQATLCVAPSIIQKLSSGKASSLAYWVELIAVYDTFKNPFKQASELKSLAEQAIKPVVKQQAMLEKIEKPNEIPELAEQTASGQCTYVTTGDASFDIFSVIYNPFSDTTEQNSCQQPPG